MDVFIGGGMTGREHPTRFRIPQNGVFLIAQRLVGARQLDEISGSTKRLIRERERRIARRLRWEPRALSEQGGKT